MAGNFNDLQLQLMLNFAQQTGMMSQYAQQCLQETGWDMHEATRTFDRVRHTLPAEAFRSQLPPNFSAASAEQLASTISAYTGMVKAYSVDCLEQNGWDLQEAKAAFQRVRDCLPVDAFTAPVYSAPQGRSVREQLALTLTARTGMVTQYSCTCLERCGWDLGEAMAVFQCMRDRLPEDAFIVPVDSDVQVQSVKEQLALTLSARTSMSKAYALDCLQQNEWNLVKAAAAFQRVKDRLPGDAFKTPINSATEAQPAKACRLLQLPAELRNHIYEYLICGSEVHITHNPATSQQPPLSRTSKLFRNEILPMFYTSATFIADIKSHDTTAVSAWLRAMDADIGKHVRTLHIRLDEFSHELRELPDRPYKRLAKLLRKKTVCRDAVRWSCPRHSDQWYGKVVEEYWVRDFMADAGYVDCGIIARCSICRGSSVQEPRSQQHVVGYAQLFDNAEHLDHRATELLMDQHPEIARSALQADEFDMDVPEKLILRLARQRIRIISAATGLTLESSAVALHVAEWQISVALPGFYFPKKAATI